MGEKQKKVWEDEEKKNKIRWIDMEVSVLGGGSNTPPFGIGRQNVTRHMSSHEYLWLQCVIHFLITVHIDGVKSIRPKTETEVRNDFRYHCDEHENMK